MTQQNHPAAVAFASLGAMELRLESVEHRVFDYPLRPLLTMSDGLDVGVLERNGASFLVVDYRRDPARPARIELWRPTAAPELAVAGLYALCDAVPEAPSTVPSKSYSAGTDTLPRRTR